MKLVPILSVILAAAGGWYAGMHWHHGDGAAGGARKILYYQSPMHPWVKSDKPGECTVCGMDLVPVYEGGAGAGEVSPDIVMLPQGTPEVVGVQTAEVKKQPLLRTLRVAGVIGEDESKHGVICAPVECRVDGLAMNVEGQQITQRQPVATIFSRTLLNAASEYKLALDQGSPAQEEAKRRLERYGLVWEQIKVIPQRQPNDIYFGLLASRSGTIVKCLVSEGQYVKEGERLFELADFTTMWFVFPVYEQDLPFVQTGQMAAVTLPSLPGENKRARVSFIDPNLDEATRSARVHIVLENPDRRIKNKSYATGVIDLTAPEVVAIPRSAVLWPGTQPRVYVEKAPGSYERRPVKLGRAGDDLWEVLEGLKEGERVVRVGAMILDGQAQLDDDSKNSGLEAKR